MQIHEYNTWRSNDIEPKREQEKVRKLKRVRVLLPNMSVIVNDNKDSYQEPR
jgi:hypothetical protein